MLKAIGFKIRAKKVKIKADGIKAKGQTKAKKVKRNNPKINSVFLSEFRFQITTIISVSFKYKTKQISLGLIQINRKLTKSLTKSIISLNKSLNQSSYYYSEIF